MYTNEQRAAWARAHYQKNKDKAKAANERYRANNIDKVRQTMINWRTKSCYDEQYYLKHRDKIIKAVVVHNRIKYRTDPIYRIASVCRSRMGSALRGIKKANRTFNLIGCTPNELKNYLAQLFKPGMSWNNYGEWHIDHIVPCSVFELSDPVEQKQCFHYSNLQPLWAKDNLHKSNKISVPLIIVQGECN